MCLGELGRVVSVDGDVAVVHTARGAHDASLLLAPAVAVGDDVVVHSGHVLSVVTADEAATAAALRAGDATAARVTPIDVATRPPPPTTAAGG